MERKRLMNAIHAAIFNRNITSIKRVGDFYKDTTGVDISNLRLNVINEQKEVFEWILANPNYDFNSLFQTHFTNRELLEYFEIYYQDILFTLDKFNKREFIINPNSFK